MIFALVASFALASCADLPDPDHSGKVHAEDEGTLSREEVLARVLSRVASNAEKYRNYDAAHTFYSRSHLLDTKKPEPLLGMGRSLMALDAPLEASEAYGAVLALNESNQEAEAGLARSLDMLAVESAKTPAKDMPPPPVVAADSMPGADPAEPDMAAAPEGAMAAVDDAMAAASMADGATVEKDSEAAAEEAAGATSEANMADNAAGADPNAPPAKFDDVLAAIEWQEGKGQSDPNAANAERGGMSAESALEVASAQPSQGTDDPVMADTPAATPMAAMADAMAYRLQLAVYGTHTRAENGRVRIKHQAADLLKDISLNIDETTSGAKKVFKLRTGPIGDRTRASEVCASLKLRSIDCFLVKPKKTHASATTTTPIRSMVATAAPAPTRKAATAKPAAKPAMGWEIVSQSQETDGSPKSGDDGETKTAPDGSPPKTGTTPANKRPPLLSEENEPTNDEDLKN